MQKVSKNDGLREWNVIMINNITGAARSLYDSIKGHDWLNSVGVGTFNGNLSIFVYVKNDKYKKLGVIPRIYNGFDVIVREIGKVVLL